MCNFRNNVEPLVIYLLRVFCPFFRLFSKTLLHLTPKLRCSQSYFVPNRYIVEKSDSLHVKYNLTTRVKIRLLGFLTTMYMKIAFIKRNWSESDAVKIKVCYRRFR